MSFVNSAQSVFWVPNVTTVGLFTSVTVKLYYKVSIVTAVESAPTEVEIAIAETAINVASELAKIFFNLILNSSIINL